MKKTTFLIWELGLMVAVLLNMWFGSLSFDSPRLNYLIVGLALSLPWLMPLNAFEEKALLILNKFVVLTLRILSILCLIIWVFFAFIYSDAIIHNIDYSFEKIKNIKIKNNNYAVYRTNGGAMTALGIVVQKENYILPYFKYSSVVYEKYPASKLIEYKEVSGKITFKAK